MSRAFVKEPEGDQAEDDLPERPQSDLPNYITPAGVATLRAKWSELQAEQEQLKSESEALASRNRKKMLEQELNYLEQRIQSAIVITPAEQTRRCHPLRGHCRTAG
ncbi:MAG: hypothetical protein U5P41_12285 [Gammaproteobacteria bacterium]|nr:hypothetical protein [Gammaproteobacteria bacterium]